MRRSTQNVERVAAMFGGFARAVAQLSEGEVARRIELLEPLVTEARRARLESVIGARIASITVLLDSLHDPFNGAAVLRSCDVFGIAKLHVIERAETFLASKSVSRGSEQWVDVVTHASGDEAISELRGAGFQLVAASADGELTPEELRAETRPIALVAGNERDGIAANVRSRCDKTVRVAMRGFAESLNVSVTTAILLHELTKGRPGDLSELERARLKLRGLLQSIGRSVEILDANCLALPEVSGPHAQMPKELPPA